MKLSWLAILALLITIGCNTDFKSNFNSNRLSDQPSPYLQLHAQNPIWWQPWEEDVLKYAKTEEKLILLSIGYSTCHWCHVMEHDVFAQADFAKVANRDFVAIKVDREQRPDLDAYFLKALQAITKTAGWPITLVLTPDLQPVFGATYVPKDKMIYILEELQKAWTDQRDLLKERGIGVETWIQRTSPASIGFARDSSLIQKFFKAAKKVYDPVHGGRRGQVKFPMNDELRLLLRIHKRTGNTQALKIVTRTVEKMIKGGLYDHIGGGVFRYSTNPQWTLPHFEKMLYDQASFLMLLTELQQVQPSSLNKGTIASIIAFLKREMSSPTGGFYSAIDADSENKEGLFYTWKPGEIRTVLSSEQESAFVKDFLLLPPQKSLDNRLVFTRRNDEVSLESAKALKKLMTHRDKRPRPLTDKKIITAWNGLILSALARQAMVSGSEELQMMVEKNIKRLLKRHLKRSSLVYRFSIAQKTYGDGTADDYAFFVNALIQTYQLTFNSFYLRQALEIQKTMDRLYLDRETGSYRFTKSQEKFFKDLKIFQDGVRPSAQAVTFENLTLLSHFFLDRDLGAQADRLARQYPDILETHPMGFSRLLIGIDFKEGQAKELVIVGSLTDCKEARRKILKNYEPNLIFACSNEGHSQIALTKSKKKVGKKATYYLCTNGTCLTPKTILREVVESLKDSGINR